MPTPSDLHAADTDPRTRGSSAAASGRPDLGDLCEVNCVNQDRVDRVRHALPAPATVQGLAEMFKALGDPTRLLLVSALAREELCVCDLATLVGVSQSAVSHSLRTLRQLRVVRFRKVGKIAYYSLDDAHVAHLAEEGMRHAAERPA